MTAVITCAVMPKNFVFLSIEFIVIKLYVNSFMALMNARYYLQTNVVSVGSECHVRHEVYHPELHINTSQDDKAQTNVSDDVVLHITRPGCRVTEDGDHGQASFHVGVTDY